MANEHKQNRLVNAHREPTPKLKRNKNVSAMRFTGRATLPRREVIITRTDINSGTVTTSPNSYFNMSNVGMDESINKTIAQKSEINKEVKEENTSGIYIKDLKNPKNVEEILDALFNGFYDCFDACLKSVETYSDISCSSLQCQQYTNRSLKDVLKCVNTYFPNVTKKQLLILLLGFNKTVGNKKYKFYFMYCPDIEEPVMFLSILNESKEKLTDIIVNHIAYSHIENRNRWFNIFKTIGVSSVETLRIFYNN